MKAPRATLLLVDDDRHVLASMADWLRDQGYQLDTANSYATAVAALDRRGYDLVLADVDTALDTSSAVRELNRVSVQCKVVLWSSLRSPVTETGRHTRCDAAAVLQKPYDSRAIYYELDKVIAARCED